MFKMIVLSYRMRGRTSQIRRHVGRGLGGSWTWSFPAFTLWNQDVSLWMHPCIDKPEISTKSGALMSRVFSGFHCAGMMTLWLCGYSSSSFAPLPG